MQLYKQHNRNVFSPQNIGHIPIKKHLCMQSSVHITWHISSRGRSLKILQSTPDKGPQCCHKGPPTTPTNRRATTLKEPPGTNLKFYSECCSRSEQTLFVSRNRVVWCAVVLSVLLYGAETWTLWARAWLWSGSSNDRVSSKLLVDTCGFRHSTIFLYSGCSWGGYSP